MGRAATFARVTGERGQQGSQRGGLSTFFRMGRIPGVEIGVRTSTHFQDALTLQACSSSSSPALLQAGSDLSPGPGLPLKAV